MILTIAMAAALAAPTNAASPAQRARANLNQYFSTDDYPPTAIARGAEGTVGFRLDIGADGAVISCTVTHSANDAALDAATCAILLGRARYQPARDSAGRAVRGKDEGRVTWRLPAPEDEPFAELQAPARLELTVATAADGRPVCSAKLNGGESGADGEALCAQIAGAGGDAFVRELPRDSAVTMTVAFGLDGEAPAPGTGADRGELFMESLARLTVAADGRVSDCRMGETNVHGEIGPMPTPVLCRFPGFANRMFPAARAGAAPRSGTMRFEIHVRLGASRRAI